MKRRYFLHLAALSSFALAQPLFAKLGPAPGYFAAHDMGPYTVTAFAVGLIVLPPALLLLVELAAGLFGRRARWVAHLLLLAALAALVVLPLAGALPTALAYGVATLLGLGFAAAYARFRRVREAMSTLMFAPALFALVFLLVSPTRSVVLGAQLDAWRAPGSFRPPVVFIEFDSLSSLLLETPGHQVDAVRFPSFARLARDGVWYRNASSMSAATAASAPSFVDGQPPRRRAEPVVQDHTPNLFTLLGPGYRMNVAEEATALCPYELCRRRGEDHGSLLADTWRVLEQTVLPAGERRRLPSIRQRWVDFGKRPRRASFKTRPRMPQYVLRRQHGGRLARFEHWLARVGRGGARPELDYIHVYLPREPREYLPDGKRYVADPALSAAAEQRGILQLGFTDRVLGRVIARLKQAGIYDDALVVVAAPQGESFVAGGRRSSADVSSIPIFIKYPKGHGPHGIDSRYVRSVDVFPTIAGELGLKLPPLAGRDLRDPAYQGHSTVGARSVARWQRARQASLRRRLRLFGYGSRPVYESGPAPALVGRPVTAFVVVAATTPVATIDNAQAFKSVDPTAPVCVCLVAGRISGADPAGLRLAVALDGRIVATTVGFAARGAKRLNWAALVPPGAYHDGDNQLQLFQIEGPRRLARIGTAG